MAKRLVDSLAEVFRGRGVPLDCIRGLDGRFFFTDGPVTDLTGAKKADTALYARFFHAMLDRGFYFAPSQFETGFLSLVHTEAEIDRTVAAADDALTESLRVPLVCLGLSHHTAPVEVRERHAFAPARWSRRSSRCTTARRCAKR